MAKPNTIWQKMYDAIDGISTPDWLVGLLQRVQDIIFQIILQIGKDYLDKLKDMIIKTAKESITNEAKFKKVYDFALVELKLSISDSQLRLLIESVYSSLKSDKTV